MKLEAKQRLMATSFADAAMKRILTKPQYGILKFVLERPVQGIRIPGNPDSPPETVLVPKGPVDAMYVHWALADLDRPSQKPIMKELFDSVKGPVLYFYSVKLGRNFYCGLREFVDALKEQELAPPFNSSKLEVLPKTKFTKPQLVKLAEQAGTAMYKDAFLSGDYSFVKSTLFHRLKESDVSMASDFTIDTFEYVILPSTGKWFDASDKPILRNLKTFCDKDGYLYTVQYEGGKSTITCYNPTVTKDNFKETLKGIQ